ncbi:ATP-grasp domain-containing protein [Haliangium sp.]|uniref:ATP-grasp domain-containing protein n=1 Tax=Haliangium sp. TaxID=2663208 RepID=UPI003D13E72D
MDIALVTCETLPEPDRDQLPLSEALTAAGIDFALWAWEDQGLDWSRPRLALLRSTWNYPLAASAFLAWAERAAALTRLYNPLPVVRWNAHKGYLLELAAAGVPVTPTALVPQGSSDTLSALLAARSWDEVVIKPAVSAASYRTLRVGRGDLAAGEAHLAALVAERDVLVQPYLASVDDYGERALVWIDGELTHAVRKAPRFEGGSESVSEQAVAISAEEAALAQRTLALAREHLDAPLLYARVDVAPGPDGRPVVMELELVEPSLFFAQGPAALERLVAALERELLARALRS